MKKLQKKNRPKSMQAQNKLMISQRMIDMSNRYVGIVAAPGAPDELARKIKEELPEVLSEEFEDDHEWEVGVHVDPLTSYAELTKELFQKTDQYYQDSDWDYTIFITDLPLYHNESIIGIDINEATEVGLVSLPAYGWPPNKQSVLETIVTLITSVQAKNDKESTDSNEENRRNLKRIFNRYFKFNKLHYEKSHNDATDSEHSIYQMKNNLRGYLRLISGMAWANNPLNMMLVLSSVVALAFATGSFSMVFSTMWSLSDLFSIWRMIAVSIFALASMLVWIIISHDLWERLEEGEDKRFLKLYNGATVVTLIISLVFYFTVLYLMFLTGSLVLLPPDFIIRNIGLEQIDIRFYLKLAWFATSLSTVVAAIGAGVQDENIMKESTYGYRHRLRSQEASEE
ncbi:5,10-methylene-tetrahydrofolate dehydrogenase [Salinicoccus siamensis]